MIRVPALHPSRPHATPCDTARDDPSQCPKMDTRHADGASGTTKWCLGSQMGVPELSPDDLRLRRRALWDALNSAGRRGVYRAGSRRGEDTRTFYERDESAMLRVRGGFSRPQTCSDQTSTKPTWWPQRDSDPCSHIAARFCKRIRNLRRVVSASIGPDRHRSLENGVRPLLPR
jgi:hypothetical protein